MSNRKFMLVSVPIAAALYFGGLQVVDPAKALAATVAFGVLGIAAWAKWASRDQVAYWVTLTVLVIADLVAILKVPWREPRLTQPVLHPVGIIVGMFDYGCLTLAVKVFGRTKSPAQSVVRGRDA